jgi:hypothetical protein
MSEPFPHGHHPDADLLSAFAQHVLPDHERLETIAHLAECADCRQIVFLAQSNRRCKPPATRSIGRHRVVEELAQSLASSCCPDLWATSRRFPAASPYQGPASKVRRRVRIQCGRTAFAGTTSPAYYPGASAIRAPTVAEIIRHREGGLLAASCACCPARRRRRNCICERKFG